MSLSSDISTISSSLNAIKNAIVEKGVTPTGDITTYANAISQISSGASTKLTEGTYTLTYKDGLTYTIIITESPSGPTASTADNPDGSTTFTIKLPKA